MIDESHNTSRQFSPSLNSSLHLVRGNFVAGPQLMTMLRPTHSTDIIYRKNIKSDEWKVQGKLTCQMQPAALNYCLFLFLGR